MTIQKIYDIYQKVDNGRFNIEDLGCFYNHKNTTFKIYQPLEDELYLIIDNKEKYSMNKYEDTFSLTINKDLEGHLYHFQKKDGTTFLDPFSYADSKDRKNSYILDNNKFIKEIIKTEKRNTNIIYELNVRDFTAKSNLKEKETFLGLIKNHLIGDYNYGLDYLKELGISHIQIMPIFDYDNDNSDYNWGYNPLSYTSLKHDYIYNHNDPYNLINEFRYVVNTFHENNIKVILDVVFNHVYQIENDNLNKYIPYYFFRYKEDGTSANGTWCGNEVRSEGNFTRAYLSKLVRRYIELFDIDGLRFDLMGIIDIDTINQIKNEAYSLKEDFLLYGEAWNMGDVISEDYRASEDNLSKIYPVGSFNRFFRDDLIEFSLGDISKKDYIKSHLAGYSIDNLNPIQTINYVECHDNQTFYDRLIYLDEQEKIERCIFALALTILARGNIFIHCGQEFFISKDGIDNSYNSSIEINGIDWNRANKYRDNIEYFKKLIEFRKKYEYLFTTDSMINFYDYYELLVYELQDYIIFINPSSYEHIYKDGNYYEIIIDPNGNPGSSYEELFIPPFSILICHKS